MKKLILFTIFLTMSNASFSQERGGAGGVKGGGSDLAVIQALMWSYPHKTFCEILEMAVERNPQLVTDEEFIQLTQNCLKPFQM